MKIKIDMEWEPGEGTQFETESDQPMALLGVLMAAARCLLERVLGYTPEVKFTIEDRNVQPKDLVK